MIIHKINSNFVYFEFLGGWFFGVLFHPPTTVLLRSPNKIIIHSFCAPAPNGPCWHLPLLLPWHCCHRPPPSADVIQGIVITSTRELMYEFPLLLDAVLVLSCVRGYYRTSILDVRQADRGCARSWLLICSSKEDGTYYNQFSRYFTTLYGMIHQKRGGTLRRGYGLKEQEMTM